MCKPVLLFLLLSLLLVPSIAAATVITADTTWTGEVSVEKDVLVPEGVTLTIRAGAVVRFLPSDSTKTDPEFMSPLTEMMVRGTLVVDGRRDAPVIFLASSEKKSGWAGIIVDNGKVILRSCIIRDAETGVDAISGSVSLLNSQLIRNRYGMIVHGRDTAVRTEATQVKENDYGFFLLNGAKVDLRNTVIQGNSRKDRYIAETKVYPLPAKEYKEQKGETSRIYHDEALLGTTVWRGRIEVRGVLRVPEDSRLIIIPGTLVEFTRTDSNHDGIGENGLLIQGILIAKGTPEHPIIFRSAEKQRRMGDWDAINIMNSERTQNLIEYCQIEDAYRGLHFHFSNVAVTESIIRNNYRGIQFQESVVEIRGTRFIGNKSALQARDSDMLFSDNVVYRNYSGINVFRNTLTLRDNLIMNNEQDGLRVREGTPVVEENLIDGNRYGLMVIDTVYGTFARNVIAHNSESGTSLRGTDNIEFSGNVVQGNGLYGMNLLDASAVIRGNLIADNQERGIGVQSFYGLIHANNILKNGLYSLGLDGETDVSAGGNWWGGEDLKQKIYDKDNDLSKGRAERLPLLAAPVVFPWPLQTVLTDTAWYGILLMRFGVSVARGVTLDIAPSTRVLFSKGAGLAVREGRIRARGEQKAPITFASSRDAFAGAWDEILVDHAEGSVFSHCVFEHATWALHSHFTNLQVEACSFEKNYGGLRFTSGPVNVGNSSFRDNEIGIRAFRGTARIAENVITNNRIGIFVREKGGGLTITHNDLFANSEYNIRLGDFNDEDVDAQDNWWGEGNPADLIFDSRLEPGIGRVRFEPYLTKPVRQIREGTL